MDSGKEEKIDQSNPEDKEEEEIPETKSSKNSENEIFEKNIIQPKYEKIYSILISYPNEVETMFGSTMIYKVIII